MFLYKKKEIYLFLIKENESRTRAGLIIIWFLLILRNNALRLVSKTNESWATWGWELLAFSKESVLRARGVASVMQIQMMPTARGAVPGADSVGIGGNGLFTIIWKHSSLHPDSV